MPTELCGWCRLQTMTQFRAPCQRAGARRHRPVGPKVLAGLDPARGTYSPPFAFFSRSLRQRGASCGHPNLFSPLAFSSAAERRELPHRRSSPCGPTLCCVRILASRPFDGVTATVLFGAATALSGAAMLTARTQPPRRVARMARSLPRALKFSGSIFHAGADGSIRRLRDRALGDEHGTSDRLGLSA
jgi:hypothetical protein